jgi:hypothetical protein
VSAGEFRQAEGRGPAYPKRLIRSVDSQYPGRSFRNYLCPSVSIRGSEEGGLFIHGRTRIRTDTATTKSTEGTKKDHPQTPSRAEPRDQRRWTQISTWERTTGNWQLPLLTTKSPKEDTKGNGFARAGTQAKPPPGLRPGSGLSRLTYHVSLLPPPAGFCLANHQSEGVTRSPHEIRRLPAVRRLQTCPALVPSQGRSVL